MIDLKELERELQSMKPRQQLYELIKAEMKRRGRWKNKSRGWNAKPDEQQRYRSVSHDRE